MLSLYKKIVIALLCLPLIVVAKSSAPQVKSTTIFPGYVLGADVSQAGMSMREYVPANETVENWTHMVTEMRFSDIPQPPVRFYTAVGRKWLQICPSAIIKPFTAETDTIGTGYLACPLNPLTKQPEYTLFVFSVKGGQLTIWQKAFKMAPSQNELGEWRGLLEGIL